MGTVRQRERMALLPSPGQPRHAQDPLELLDRYRDALAVIELMEMHATKIIEMAALLRSRWTPWTPHYDLQSQRSRAAGKNDDQSERLAKVKM